MRSRRRRHAVKLALLMVLVGSTVPTTGCDPAEVAAILQVVSAVSSAAAQAIGAVTGTSLSTGAMPSSFTAPPTASSPLPYSSTSTPGTASPGYDPYGTGSPGGSTAPLGTGDPWVASPSADPTTTAGQPPADTLGSAPASGANDGLPTSDTGTQV